MKVIIFALSIILIGCRDRNQVMFNYEKNYFIVDRIDRYNDSLSVYHSSYTDQSKVCRECDSYYHQDFVAPNHLYSISDTVLFPIRKKTYQPENQSYADTTKN